MGNSMLIAKILGPYMVIVAIGILCNLKSYQKMMEDFLKNTALIYLGGVFALIVGLLIVLFHNVWMVGWQVIITIFGWIALIKGIWLIVFPNSVGKVTQAYQKRPGLLAAHLIVILIIGVFLMFKAYLA